MKITKELLKEWDACIEGYKWFIQKFPLGASVQKVVSELRLDSRPDDAGWLFEKVLDYCIHDPAAVKEFVTAVLEPVEGDEAFNLTSGDFSRLAASGNYSRLTASGGYSQLAASGDCSQLAASGDCSRLAASGYGSRLASSGDRSQLAASGYSSRLAASGDFSQLAASGYGSQLTSSGDCSRLAASGYCSRLAALGKGSVAMAAGLDSCASAGEDGAFALTWKDQGRVRIAVGIVGENGVKPNTLYEVDAQGNLVESSQNP